MELSLSAVVAAAAVRKTHSYTQDMQNRQEEAR